MTASQVTPKASNGQPNNNKTFVFRMLNFYMRVLFLQKSTSGVYARLWKRIQENREESLCLGNGDYCIDRWLKRDHLVYIGTTYLVKYPSLCVTETLTKTFRKENPHDITFIKDHRT